jgi:hypothetical protein
MTRVLPVTVNLAVDRDRSNFGAAAAHLARSFLDACRGLPIRKPWVSAAAKFLIINTPGSRSGFPQLLAIRPQFR